MECSSCLIKTIRMRELLNNNKFLIRPRQIENVKIILSISYKYLKCLCIDKTTFRMTVISKLKEFQTLKGMKTYAKKHLQKLKKVINCSGITKGGLECKRKKEQMNEWYCEDHKEQSEFLYSLTKIIGVYVIPEIVKICKDYYSQETKRENARDYYAHIGDSISLERILKNDIGKNPTKVIYIFIEKGYLLMLKNYIKKYKIKVTQEMLEKAYKSKNFEIFEYIERECTKEKYPDYIKWKEIN